MSCILRSGTRNELGGKAFALDSLARENLPIPEWFVVSPEAFQQSLAHVNTPLKNLRPEDNREELEHLTACPSVVEEIAAAVSQLAGSNDSLFAVRSSAVDEDSSGLSFAGQLESYLFVPAAAVPAKVAAVWRSGFSERVFTYRTEHGLQPVPATAPAVLVQRMIDADAAGVAFSSDPVSGRRGIAVVSAVFGLGTALVSGEVDADVYEVDRNGVVQRAQVAVKETKHQEDRNTPEGVSSAELPRDQQNARVLDDDQVAAVAALTRQTARHFGWPVDIEWAIAGKDLYLLQARPITTLRDLPDPDGVLNIWDNSNITESYSGVTTPLTFSFARFIYEGVYREFCRILRVPRQKIEANEQIFRRMLGLIRGRVYYNLLNWYRMLALLPGFTLNRRFMEQMMGVREPLPSDIADRLAAANWRQRARDAWDLVSMLAGLLWNYVTLEKQITAFYARLNRALAEPFPALSEMRIDELTAHYHELEFQLLTHWDAPLVNDFFAMIFHGSLRKLAERWIGDGDRVANDLVREAGKMISVEPATRLRELAKLAALHPGVVEILRQGSPEEALRAVRSVLPLSEKFVQYVDRFGDRCLEELKLESPTLHDDPTVLLRSIGDLAARLNQSEVIPEIRDRSSEAKAESRLRWHPFRRMVFGWVLRNARARVRSRENLRFERTRLFGRIRRIFVEIGRRLSAVDLLRDPKDIFYLQVEEVLGFVEGTAATTNLKELVDLRRAEFQKYRAAAVPADRFSTHGVVYQDNSFASPKHPEEVSGQDDERRGMGCCPGVVRGKVCVITDPRGCSLPQGCILVAEHTDPGWVMLFPAAAGLIVERGSLLSHSAIVSREMGIPSVVSVVGVTRWLRDGDLVELDGGTGVIRKLTSEEAHA
jgi:phosphohistidine swiveling domain-containing protein